jgi:hypothetical protein
MTAIKSTLHDSINKPQIPLHLKCLSAALTFITEKWVSLTDQVQEVISETEVPNGTSLSLLGTMIKRKHMFSEVNRTLETLCESIIEPELSNSRKKLEKVERGIENWVRGLESTISLSSNYLSLDESKRAMAQW